MKIAAKNVVEFIVILFLHANGALSMPSNSNKDNDLNPYNIEIIPLQFSIDGKTKFNPVNSKENEKALTKKAWRWSLGIVHYYVDVSSYDYLVSFQIRSAMNILETSTCIKFSPLLVKPEGSERFIHITNQKRERDCNHEPWYKDTGEIVLVLGYDCLSNVNILHSLLHALGLKDAVTHPQRDKYIRVLWNNIQPAYRHLYNIQEEPSAAVEYDPMSIMHFSDRDYTVNGQATIEPVVSGLVINPSESLSPLDKLRLRLLFGHVCNRREVHNILKTCRNTFHKNEEKKEVDKEETELEILKEEVKSLEPDDKDDKNQNEDIAMSNTEAETEERGEVIKNEEVNNSVDESGDKNNNVNANGDRENSDEEVTVKT